MLFKINSSEHRIPENSKANIFIHSSWKMKARTGQTTMDLALFLHIFH